MNKQIKSRLAWVGSYENKQNAGYVCRHCGISRPSLREWYKRYQEKGIDGLKNLKKNNYLLTRR